MVVKAKARAGARQKKTAGKAQQVIEKKPAFQGWSTSDAEEVERRRWRGRTEIVSCEALEDGQSHFGNFRVRSLSAVDYVVEIRSLAERENSCSCHDFVTNGLGTCKHIEGALNHLRQRGKRAFAAAAKTGSPRVEIYATGRGEPGLRLLWPGAGNVSLARERIEALVQDLEQGATDALQSLRDLAAKAPGSLRVSRTVERWLDEGQRAATRRRSREAFLADVEAGRQTLDVVGHPLLPYQVEGMLHLAFGERALLADDMGLGKTVQAIAACALLRRLHGIGRVLVVSPASLKSEWQEQIGRFTNFPVRIVAGPRAKRLAQYGEPAFFTLTNYEQIISDGAEINRVLAPDVVILDEAQRIKNWQTKTARAVKGLRSRYAFVLTGTPLENRIDEVYSIVQYLDPKLLGPLFRFNRDYYVLDERGRPVDYKNLEDLGRRLRPVMLRRRKGEVETQLPGRTMKNYFVAMTEEQRLRYADYEAPAQRLIAQAQRRPLLKAEFDRLQQILACMRMVCDTPYILDPECRDCPKLEELEHLLGELLAEEECKIIIFSEWVRMLELVRELAVEMNVEFAWHTGQVPQERRRAEINRFKKDPACRLFLSSESGGVGLNLQVANTVINMDLPWNPAKLEQRIARAWRKNQTRPVSVINLVCENSIEHRMVFLLNQKQALAEGVLDGLGDLKGIRMPTGRAAFVERMQAMMADVGQALEAAPDPALATRDDLLDRHGDRLLALVGRADETGRESLIAVLDDAPDRLQEESQRLKAQSAIPVEVLDRASFEAIRRLEAAGLLRFVGDAGRELHRAPALDDGGRAQRLQQAGALAAEADRKLRMSALLAGGGFEAEAMAPAKDALGLVLKSLATVSDDEAAADEATAVDLAGHLAEKGLLPADCGRAIAPILAEEGEGGLPADQGAEARIAPIRDLLVHTRKVMEAAGPN